MLSLASDDAVFDHLRPICERRLPDSSLVLIGGCSRTGKSVLAAALDARFRRSGIPSVVLPLDAWLLGVEDRAPGSTVTQRYEGPAIVRAVEALLAGEPVVPPGYDARTRRRVEPAPGPALAIRHGVILADGVVALALPELVRLAQCRIHVSIPDDVRAARLETFYTEFKGLTREAARAVITEREAEEVPFIAATAARADVRFTPTVIQEAS